MPDYVERVLAVGRRVHAIENGELGWREPRSNDRRGGRRGKTFSTRQLDWNYLTDTAPFRVRARSVR